MKAAADDPDAAPEKSGDGTGWRSCRRTSSATLGKKAHFCDRHHIASATAGLVDSYPRVRCSPSMVPPELSPANAGLLCVLTAGDREHSGGPRYHPTNGWGDGWG